ncbi:MAG TPA: amino acid adenylation domain-containing protein, partial [Longimicrobium sp.]|nr:amino acid adenylation domain-containing protein [Longimicrobium sp.]
ARWRADGALEFLGRADAQVKVRGFRIEPGEIEARLREHPGVREAVVVVREDTPGDRRLAAYWTGEAVEVEALRAHLGERLPAYMVPAAFVRLERWPRTPNGKLDRRALPAPAGDAYAAGEYEEPEGETEQAVAEIWAEVLGLERVGRHDHFFELGGHSLLAVQVISRLRQVLEVEVALGELFTRPVLRDFAREVETAARAELPPIERAPRDGRIPLSFAQQRLWFLEQMGGLGSTYHMRMRRRLRGELDRAALKRALDAIVARHEVLRTVFAEVGGVPEQRIAPAEASRFHLVEHDLGGVADARAELGRLMAQAVHAPFDLERGPLIRGLLCRLAADDHLLLLTMHHIVGDAWSSRVLTRELDALYGAFRRGEPDPLPALPVQYADYAVWQRRWVEGAVLREQAEYWTRTLADAPELLELPTDHPRPARMDHAGEILGVELDEALTAGLKALSRRHGATLFMSVLAGWAVLLGRLSGQDDVVVGTPSANRGRREIEGLIGFFVNTLPLRVDLSGTPTVAGALARVKQRALEAQHHQDIPFEQVVERVDPVRTPAHTPLFQAWFAWSEPRGEGAGGVGVAGPEVEESGRTPVKFDLSLSLSERDGRILGRLTYATALFARATVERWAGYLRRLFEEMAAGGDGRPVERLALLPAGERARVLQEWNRTETEYPAGSCLHHLFEAQAERTPHAEAVVLDDERLTYAGLNARANRLAHHLRAIGVGPDARVGICVERSPELVVALLALLKAGGAYVALDPELPAERLRHMLDDSRPAALLAHAALAGRFAAMDVPVVAVDADAPLWAGQPETNPEGVGVSPEHLVYVIYTSGSTGRPKGVMNVHRNVVNRVAGIQARWRLEAGESVLQNASLGFDVSAYEIFWPLMLGARVVMTRPDGHRDPAYLVETIQRHGVGTASVVPSMLRLLVETPGVERCTTLARVPCGGEALPATLVRRLHQRLPGATLFNRYGPSEAATAVTGPVRVTDESTAIVPIGRPMPNARVYLLDRAGEPVPVGVAGELCIGGAGVGRGYLGRPDLTAERFVADPFAGEAGARMYRTGDRARWLADGAIEFLGRTDFQLKVRGFRVEPGEVEARLKEHPAVREAVVVARDDALGGTRLVAYCVAGGAARAESLRAHLGRALPDYMVPAAFVLLDRLPLTPSGKLDRAALPAPPDEAYARRGYEAPADEAEQALAEIWAEVLGVERVGRWDHFFELGGHSLLAVQVISRVRQVLEVEAALGDLFTRPVLADFARGLETAARSALPPIEPAPRGGRLPLSFAQQRLWFLEQLGGLGGTYHIRTRRRLRGELDRAALARALDGIVARHEALRTVFTQVDGVPEQRIAPADAGFHLVEHDLAGHADAAAELARLTAHEARTPFDLERGPLIRGRLFRLAADDHVLLLTMHHIVSDGWSSGVLIRELSALYAAHHEGREAHLPPLPVQYADYAVWQRRWVEGEVLREQAEYWARTLAGAPELLELPTDRPRPAKQDHAGARFDVVLGEELTAGLKALSRRQGTTLFMTLLAGWAAVLGRLAGQDDVVIGTPTANRGRGEIEGLIGFFVNTLALRVELSGAPTVAELLGRVKERALRAQQHPDIPFEQVVERLDPARTLAHHPLFQVMFAWQNTPQGAGLSLPGLELEGGGPGSLQAEAKFDLFLALQEAGGRIGGIVTYATALFDGDTVERWVGYLRRVLAGMAVDPGQRVERLALMAADERARVVEAWNRTAAEYPREGCVHELFEAQAARTPHAVAAVHAGEHLGYAELNARANRLAHHLGGLGVGPDVRVALCVERSLEMVVALLAVLKAGGTYVPLDPEYPPGRLRHMLHDSAPALVLTQARLRPLLAGAAVPIVTLDADRSAWAGAPAGNPGRGALRADHLACVLYTSGSTGRPKGVMISHRAVVNRLAWMQAFYRLEPHDPVLQKTSLNFDISLWEVFWPLSVGARLVLARPGGQMDAGYLADTIRSARVATVHFVPSMLQLFAEHPQAPGCAPPLRWITCSGEALTPALLRRFRERFPAIPLHNQYGPTEAGEVTVSACLPGGRADVPIGEPVWNTRVYVLDAAGEPVPVGVAGELYLGGDQLARGYLDRPEQTAERFVADPFAREPGARLYRTGDLARWTRDGVLRYLGRTDHQVKVRGFRVELGEIEARLVEHPGVDEAVVVAREDAPGEKRLVAYLVGGEGADAEALRAHLAAALPEYMLPAAYVRLEEWPLTPNGKLDRRALPAPDAGAYATRAYEPPEGETEQALAEIWAEVLRVERVGRHDHFFELGGHSLLAVRVVSRVRQVLGAEVALGELFTRPVLRDFARGLETAAQAELPPIEPAPREGRIPLSFAQQRLWFLEQMEELGSTYHISTRLRLRGELDRAALARALDRLVARHEALRTVFAQVDGVPEQRIAPAEASRFHLVEHEPAGQAVAEPELGRVMADEARAPFDLERGPLIRGRLVRLAADDHLLLVTMHHIVSDGWSIGVLTRELSALYEAFRRGEPDPLPALPVQYADYAVWQRRWVEGEVLREQAEYWTRTLAGAPELLELPTDRPRPPKQDFAGDALPLVLEAELTASLKALSRRQGTTLFATLLAGWATVLGRLSGQDDLVVGTPTANRGQREVEELIGFFVNTLALRLDLSGAPTVAELLGRVKERALAAQHHQDIPFEQVVERVDPVRTLAYHPLVQVTFAWQSANQAGGPPGPGVAGQDAGGAGGTAAGASRAKFDLSLSLREAGDRIAGSITFATALFDRETVERWAGYLRRVLGEMSADPGQRVERLALMPPDERERVVEEWNRTEADYPGASCIHQLFEAQVERTPGAAAVVCEGERLTYAGLNARANRLAHHLRSLGVGPGARVALAMPRSAALVQAELAVLKCGAAYVPLDPAHPGERLREVLDDSAPAVLLTIRALAERFGGLALPVVALDDDVPAWASHPAADLAVRGVTAEQLAYVMYTSGSTGRPKGVMVPHRAVLRLVFNNRYVEFGPDERVAFAANPAFDATTMEVWAPLLTGGRVVVIGPEVVLDPAALARTLEDEGVTALFVTTAVFNQYAAAIPRALAALRHLMTGGERADPASFVRVLAHGGPVRLIHCYGPTETTTFAITGLVDRVDAEARTLPLGRPIGNTRVYLLDAAGEPVPVGVTGELHVGGAGVARGYLGRPALTAERFVPDPFAARPGARLYRTGDLGRWLPDGTIEFVGRNDFQVKVRGFRVEPGEIEARLLEHPAVREAVVLAREDAPGDKRLVAYVVGGEAAGAEALRAHLAAALPEYMVPAAYVRLEEWPLTPNGKVDRRALPAPEGDAYAARAYEPPASETEQALAEIWAEVLGVERVGRHDHFFDLGGHSLLVVRVISRVRQVLEVEVAMGDLFTRPVLHEFARGLETAARSQLPPVEPAPRGGRVPLSFAQQRLWFLEQMGGLGSTYHVPTRMRLRGEIDRAALARALDRIVERHEALRTTFAQVNGVPEQRIAPAGASRFHLAEHDLAGEPNAERELKRLAAEEARDPFDLERGPLIRGRLVRLAADDHLLLVTMHHIVSDGWSIGVLTRELSALHDAFRRGAPDPLPPLGVQYADYAIWQRRWVEGEVLREQAEYWTRTLAGAPELLELSADHPRPRKQDFAGDSLPLVLDAELTAGLKALSRRRATTLFMTLLAGWATVLGRLSGQDDVVIGTPTANRGQREIEELIGFFVNTLALRLDLSGAPTVAELLGRVKERALGAQHHQDIPFEQVVERVDPARSLAYHPLVQVMFAWQSANQAGGPPGPGSDAGATGGGAVGPSQAKFDLSLSLREAGDRIAGSITFATSLFERETVERWTGYLRRVLGEMAADDG